jgi:hypothetical protein
MSKGSIQLTDALLSLGINADNLGSCLLGLLDVFHEGESENLLKFCQMCSMQRLRPSHLDGVVVGKEHDQTVNTETPATCGCVSYWFSSTVELVWSHATTCRRTGPRSLHDSKPALSNRLVQRLPVGGRPCSIEAINTSSTNCASSSPCAFWLACSSNRRRWSKGSFNSVYALQISFLQTKASKRSQRPGISRWYLARGLITYYVSEVRVAPYKKLTSGWPTMKVGLMHFSSLLRG